jgi:GMP synthase (glutamine-hydrolysing)
LGALEITNLHVYDAKQDFYEALKEVAEPERKRQIIGKKFLDIQAKAIHELGLDPDHWILGQGTIYPDTIESGGTKHADKIKTHHNRVPEIQALIEQGLIIEPLADLYKDEVRDLGEQLGLPHHLVWRHPFPGPGLAIRILCTPHKVPTLEDLSKDEKNINDFLAEHKLQGKILPVESVGVQGDARTYRHPVAISPLEGGWQDFWKKEELQHISTELTNRFESINRVMFTLHGDASDTGVLPDRYLTPERVKTIQDADKIVMDGINSFDLEEKLIWQCPTILLPLATSTDNHESLVLRPVSSIDAMTADFALIPTERLNNILEQLKGLNPSMIFYDLTNKPPGTIEWE